MNGPPLRDGIQLRLHPHPFPLLIMLGALSFFWLIYAGLLCPLSESFGIDGRCLLFTLTGFFLVGSVLVADWLLTVYIVSTDRLIVRRGILARSEMMMEVLNIEDIRVDQSVIGRIIGYSNIRVESAGKKGMLVLRGVARGSLIAQLLIGLKSLSTAPTQPFR